MNLQTQISQQQASVKMLEKLLKANRATQQQLDQANSRLADLRQQENFTPLPVRAQRVDQPVPTPPVPLTSQPRIEGDEYNRIQADLSLQLDKLTKQQAGLSNQLHLTPPHISCKPLTQQILSVKAQIEALWDKKRYLERNHTLPEEKAQEAKETGLPVLPGNEEARYSLAYQKRRLIDKRSKLRDKLKNPKAKPSKIQQWEQELAYCDLMIREIEIKLNS